MDMNMTLNVRICEKKSLDIKKSISFVSEDAYTMIYVVRGRGKTLINNSSLQLQTNTVMCIKPQCMTKISSSEENMELIYFQYAGGEADYLYRSSSFKKTGPLCIVRSREIFWCFESIYAEFMEGKSNRYYLVAEILHIFSHFTQRMAVKESRKYHNRYLQKAVDVIQDNQSMPISVNILAECVNIDRSYLYRIFKKETLLSPREYIIDYKLTLSIEEIKKKSDNIQSIFEKLGFSSYYLAEKKFKEKYGMTPREYQKQENFGKKWKD